MTTFWGVHPSSCANERLRPAGLLLLCGFAFVFEIVSFEQSVKFVAGKFSCVQLYFLLGRHN